MRRIAFALITLLAIAPALRADDPPKANSKEPAKANQATPAQQYQMLVQEYAKAQQDFSKRLQQAQTPEERNKILQEKRPKPAEYAAKAIGLAQSNPKDPAALDALIWVVTRIRGSGPETNQALDLLVEQHLDSPRLGSVAGTLIYTPSNHIEKFLGTIMEKSPHSDVQGKASFNLGQYLKNQANDPRADAAVAAKLNAQAEVLFERVIKDFGSVAFTNIPLRELAKRELFEIRHLAVGKQAPDIKGEDLDGTPFKLSDYLGKVVVLDFWGHW